MVDRRAGLAAIAMIRVLWPHMDRIQKRCVQTFERCCDGRESLTEHLRLLRQLDRSPKNKAKWISQAIDDLTSPSRYEGNINPVTVFAYMFLGEDDSQLELIEEDVFGQVRERPKHLTSDIETMTITTYRDRSRDGSGRFDPIQVSALADALEEAGYDNQSIRCKNCKGNGKAETREFGFNGSEYYETSCKNCRGWGRRATSMLAHLREPRLHVRGCWVVDRLLEQIARNNGTDLQGLLGTW